MHLLGWLCLRNRHKGRIYYYYYYYCDYLVIVMVSKLSMYVCMYVYIYIYIYTPIYLSILYIDLSIYLSIYLSISLSLSLYLSLYIYIYTHIHTHVIYINIIIIIIIVIIIIVIIVICDPIHHPEMTPINNHWPGKGEPQKGNAQHAAQTWPISDSQVTSSLDPSWVFPCSGPVESKIWASWKGRGRAGIFGVPSSRL